MEVYPRRKNKHSSGVAGGHRGPQIGGRAKTKIFFVGRLCLLVFDSCAAAARISLVSCDLPLAFWNQKNEAYR